MRFLLIGFFDHISASSCQAMRIQGPLRGSEFVKVSNYEIDVQDNVI